MESIDIVGIARQVAWLAFGLGVIFGATSQRTHFCTMGALADIASSGDWTRMRQWLLAIAVAVLGTNLLAYFGFIDLSKSIYTSPRIVWLANLTGGALFGFGMVLVGGCGSKTLVRIGNGNLKSVVVFIVLGLSAFMTLKGILALPRANLLEPVSLTLSTTQDLPSIAAKYFGTKHALQLIITGAVSLPLMFFVFASKSFRTTENILAGLVIGAVIAAAWFISGNLGYVAEDPATLQEAFVATNSHRMESFSFVAPYAYLLDLLMMWTDQSKAVTFGIAASSGVVSGSLACALVTRSFRWEGFTNIEDLAHHLIGAALMGFGGITALGCTIGQGLSGVSTLSVGSILTLAAIIVGAFAALNYQSWRVGRNI
ncbi:YeeE/YedE family protein [soil metagenome]